MEQTNSKNWFYEDGVKKRAKPYNSFACIKARCSNPNNPYYEFYGGRGIMCLYNSFEEFYSDVGEAPTKLHSIDRVDNSKHYQIGNCRWATKGEQLRNTRKTIFITHDGETKVLKDWAIYLGVSYPTLVKRHRKGQSIFKPINKKCRNKRAK